MSDDRAYKLDIPGLSPSHGDESARASDGKRPWVGVRFDCCCVYTRVYRDADASAYEGRCPKCGRKVRLVVGPKGTRARFFAAE
ncbi:MAG: hypothetical protein HY287_10030 [Planctomycetes bacterium]|nr:hypothetical protein [Planctomycetota bacterium]MBI3834653.1 hypothetical protein [Planctomycetota bacterium]